MRRGVWATALLVVAGAFGPAAAQTDAPLAPVGPPPGLDQLPPAAPAPTPRTDRPPPILGAPVAVLGEPVRPITELPAGEVAQPVGFTEPPALQKPTRAAGLGAPVGASPIRSEAVEAATRYTPTQPPADPVNDFLVRRTGNRGGANAPAGASGFPPQPGERERSAEKFGDRFEGWFGHGEWFRSDHCYDGFISPVTNPFLFEDPRSLTEVRPIFLYQRIPGGQADAHGGNISEFVLQGRVAFTDRFSFVIHKLGGIWINPGSGSPLGGQSGFAELWAGPKFTFIRNEATGSLLAGGLQFQLPLGSRNAFQHTGSLSLVPYASYAQNFFRDLAAGSFNTLATAGYAFSTNKQRSDYFFLSGHLDWDVFNRHRFYPLVELNYLAYTTNGQTYPIGTEGRDLINFGGQAKGTGLLTGALGARYKFTEAAQIGTAIEFPLAGRKDLFQYRWTIDFILRY